MAKQFDTIENAHRKFIEAQHMFFVGTAAPEDRVNISPKGMDSLRILGPNRLIWLNYTGSGNETAGHLLQANRMTVMWCSFTQRPMIMRAYGTAKTIHPRDAEWAELSAHFDINAGARQIYDMAVDMLQTSCGFAVPFMEFVEDRDVLGNLLTNMGDDTIHNSWETTNARTIDGAPTGIFGPET
ncbi:MAG: pyridoxamine 5'-phosphate oxidase family protein [Paracoccaceae bacterium]